MQAITLRLTPSEVSLIEVPSPETIERGKASGGVASSSNYWIDITGASVEEWDEYLEKTGMPENDREICTRLRNFPHAEDLSGRNIALKLPLRSGWKDPAAEYINIILLPRTLITEHVKSLEPLEKTRRRLLDSDKPDISDASGLLLYILQGIMEAGVNGMLKAKAEIELLEDIMETEPEKVDANELRRKKHIVEHLTSQTEEQTFALTLLRGIMSGADRHAAHDEISELLEDLAHLENSLSRLESRMAGFLGHLNSRIQARTDQRLRILTIISAVFMPLTFITGIYGMNFENMPGLSSAWGYYAIIALMLAVGGGMIFYFWKKKWFG